MAINEVGICTRSIPLSIVAATYPERSPTTPPPKPIIKEFLLNFFSNNFSSKLFLTVNDLDFSPGFTIKISSPLIFIFSL